MAIQQEIERRFLVKDIDPNIRKEKNLRITQGYLNTRPHLDLRVRITNGVEAEITKKTGVGIERTEETQPINLDAAKCLYSCCEDKVEKTRYLKDGWEVDFFVGPLLGLVLAEYEMPSRDFNLVLPPWILEAEEVTDSLNNRMLARIAHDLGDGLNDRSIRELLPKRLPRIVLTGGPCSGKTSIMKILQEKIGGVVHCVPETASMIISLVGVRPPVGDPVGMNNFQRTIYRVQRGFEDIAEVQACRDGKKILILDRGTVDGAAYMAGGLGEMECVCHTNIKYEYAQYDRIIYLDVPPADVFESHHANNPARSETYEEAKARGTATQKVWCRHPGFHHVANKNWDDKVQTVLNIISSYLYLNDI